MTSKAKFSLIEISILNKAAQRKNGYVLPLSSDIDAKSFTADRLLKRLLKSGLIEEKATKNAASAWRSDETGQHYLLHITEAGRQAASASVTEISQQPLETPATPLEGNKDLVKKPSGKLGQVLSAVGGKAGASVGDLIALTGWQPHTVRASLTRLRQTGVVIHLADVDGQKRYTIGQAAQTPAS